MVQITVNQTLIDLIFEEPVGGYVVLDLGCGDGALSFIVAKKAGKVIGIDVSGVAIEAAKRKAMDNTLFVVMDAEKEGYARLGRIDMVVSHLYMSDEAVKRAYRVLPHGGAFAFACFHADHLIEGGRRSRFSYTEGEMKSVLEKTGFKVEYLKAEKTKIGFKDKGEALKALGNKTVERWRWDGRLQHLSAYIEGGGRSLTKSILVGKARKK